MAKPERSMREDAAARMAAAGADYSPKTGAATEEARRRAAEAAQESAIGHAGSIAGSIGAEPRPSTARTPRGNAVRRAAASKDADFVHPPSTKASKAKRQGQQQTKEKFWHDPEAARSTADAHQRQWEEYTEGLRRRYAERADLRERHDHEQREKVKEKLPRAEDDRVLDPEELRRIKEQMTSGSYDV